jgi:hypothetical protein
VNRAVRHAPTAGLTSTWAGTLVVLCHRVSSARRALMGDHRHVGIKMRIACTILAFAFCSAFPIACGTGAGTSSSSGPPVDSSKTLSNLSTSEKQAFCDWTAQQEGGYGRTISCEATGSPLYTPSDQATCVSELSQHASEPGCTATVGQWTTCVQWLDANWCTTMPAVRPAECNAIQATCYGSGGSPTDGGAD